MEAGICVKEIQFIQGFEASGRETAEMDVLREAQPKLFGKTAQAFLLRTASLVVDEPSSYRMPNPRRAHRAMLKFQSVAEVDNLITVIRHAPKLDPNQIISKGLVDHREAAIEQLLTMLEGAK